MNQVVIENPVINSPFAELARHFRFAEEGITSDIVEARRESAYFVPIAAPRKKSKNQLYFETEWTKDRIEPNRFINQVRQRVQQWRENRRFGVTRVTAQLLEDFTGADEPYEKLKHALRADIDEAGHVIEVRSSQLLPELHYDDRKVPVETIRAKMIAGGAQ